MANEHKKSSPGKIALAVAAIVVLLAALIALVVSGMDLPEKTAAAPAGQSVKATTPADGNPEDVTAKGSYTASDRKVKANRETVVATMGDKTLTNGQLQVFYWTEVQSFLNNYGMYAMYFGMDYTQPLDTQIMSESGSTWQQYFLEMALNNWSSFQAMAIEAEKAGFQLDAEMQAELDNIPAMMDQNSLMYGYTDGNALLQANVGPGAIMEDYVYCNELNFIGYTYYTTLCEANSPTDAEVDAYFTENEAAYAESGLTRDAKYVNVRHLLVMPTGATSANIRTETFDETAWEEARVKAEELLAEFEAGDKTEDSFGALAMKHSQDGSASNGGLYTDVATGEMVESFDSWCFDPARQSGDYGIVKTEFGYHLMFYVSDRAAWVDQARSDLETELNQELLEGILANYTMDVDYASITLAEVSLTGETEKPLFREEHYPILMISGASLLALLAAAYVFREKKH